MARSESIPESDIDVLVVAENLPAEIGRRIDEAYPLLMGLKRCRAYQKLLSNGRVATVSSIILSPKDVKAHPPILLDMTEDGIIIYDKGDFLKEALVTLKKRMGELGSRRIKAKKGHYWILKPSIKPGEVIEI